MGRAHWRCHDEWCSGLVDGIGRLKVSRATDGRFDLQSWRGSIRFRHPASEAGDEHGAHRDKVRSYRGRPIHEQSITWGLSARRLGKTC